ncbi:MAG: hypothetical protein QFF03_10695 [Pseudomonadota bacterium]|nr:hypothetical protein [Pseudomonadota bacterium]
MNNFNDIRYVDISGISAPVNPLDIDNPYFGHTKLAKKVLMGDMQTIQWIDKDGCRRVLRFNSPIIAAIDSTSNLLIVVLHYSDKQYSRPANAVAIRQDGALDHIVTPPLSVRQVVEKMPGQAEKTTEYPVEAIAEVLEVNDRILLGLNFNYEWIERRYYDPGKREWQEREKIYRK